MTCKSILNGMTCFMLMFSVGCSGNESKTNKSYTKEAALHSAELLLVEKYGEQVLKQRPFQVEPYKDSWVIKGTLHCPGGANNCPGGVAEVSLDKESGKVNYITHGK